MTALQVVRTSFLGPRHRLFPPPPLVYLDINIFIQWHILRLSHRWYQKCFLGGWEPEDEHQLGSQKQRNDLKEVVIAMFLQHSVYHTIGSG